MNNRNGYHYIENVPFKEHNLDSKYDITCGRIADIDVVDYARRLKESGCMLDSLQGILNKKYPMQYVFHTQTAVECIVKVTYRNL